MQTTPALNPAPVHLRHIIRADHPNAPGAEEVGVGADVTILGTPFRPCWGGVNGGAGFADGEYERQLWEEGECRFRFPNGSGEDGRLHRDRFALTAKKADCRPGDEWIEVYEGDPGRLVFVGTLLDFEQRVATLELQGTGPLWTLRKAHEFQAGFWCNAPRDAFEHYTRVWTAVVSDDLDSIEFDYVDDATERTTADGRFDYLRAGTIGTFGAVTPEAPAGRVRLLPNGAGKTSIVKANATVPVGLSSSDPHAAWRVEIKFWRSGFAATTNAHLGLRNAADDADIVRLQMHEGFTTHMTEMMSSNERDGINTTPPGPFYLIIEGRDRWVYFYLDGELVAVAPMPEGDFDCYPFVKLAIDGGDAGVRWVDVDSIIVRTCSPYLMRDSDKGDYHLGQGLGDLPAGGLQAVYYDDHDLIPMAAADRPHHMLNLVKPPYHRKLEPGVNFSNSNWQPVGPANNNRWSVRFIGAIYLDLANQEYSVALNNSGTKRRRLWVGQTRAMEWWIDHWGTPQTGRAALVNPSVILGEVSGWYPIMVEYGSDTGTSSFILEWSPGATGTYVPVPATHLSPLGIYLAHVRGESHFDQLRAIAEAYGLQYECEPRQLESGAFPGHVAPKIRVGRDTEKVIDRIEADDYGKAGSIRETADTIFADAAGLADAEGGAQLTAEAIDFPLLESRLYVQTEYDQVAEIDWAPLLARRLDVLLALRHNVWEQVGAMPRGARELLDRFPMENDLALFDWRPGDGVRLDLPDVGIRDTDPRQILSLRRAFKPGGLMRPVVSFRPRPRDFLTLLRGMKLAALRRGRTYQGQLVVVSSNVAAVAVNDIPTTIARAPLPPAARNVTRATVIVHSVGSGTWAVVVDGTTALTGITEAGRYDISAWVVPRSDRAAVQVNLTGTGGVSYSVELLVLV